MPSSTRGAVTSTNAEEGGSTTTKVPTTSRAGGAGFAVPNPFTKSQATANGGGVNGQGGPSVATATTTNAAGRVRGMGVVGWGVVALVVGSLVGF